LFGANIIPMKPPISALKKAITLAEENGCELSLIRQAHLESAVLHLFNIDQQVRIYFKVIFLSHVNFSFHYTQCLAPKHVKEAT